MQTLEQLISPENSAWPILSQWIESARNHCYVIKKDQSSAERELLPCKCLRHHQWAQ